MHDAGHALAVQQHGAGDAPVRPFLVRRAGNDRRPRAEIPPAIALVQKGRRKLHEIRLVAEPNVLLAGTGRDQAWRNRRRLASRGEGLDDLAARGARIEAERKRDARQIEAWLPASSGRGAKGAKLRIDAFDAPEQRRRRALLVDPPNDGAHFQVPVDFRIDFDEFAEATKLVEIFAKAFNQARLHLRSPCQLWMSCARPRVRAFRNSGIRSRTRVARLRPVGFLTGAHSTLHPLRVSSLLDLRIFLRNARLSASAKRRSKPVIALKQSRGINSVSCPSPLRRPIR
jgi:hypothetical protein